MSRKKQAEHVNHERWLVSYADFITLLFAFFVVLFASSQTDKKKQVKLAAAMQIAFTPLGSFEAHSKTPPLTDLSAAAVSDAPPAALTPPLPSTTSLETPEETEKRLKKFLAEQVAAKLKFRHREETMMKEMMLEGVISILEGMNPRMIETKLRTFLFESKAPEGKAAEATA